MLNAFLTMKAD